MAHPAELDGLPGLRVQSTAGLLEESCSYIHVFPGPGLALFYMPDSNGTRSFWRNFELPDTIHL